MTKEELQFWLMVTLGFAGLCLVSVFIAYLIMRSLS
jgi:hypothetical protein